MGKYRFEELLGMGGMAEVFAGTTIGVEGFSRRVAIKRVLPGFSDDPAFAQMFASEAQITSRLAHPNIVSMLDFDRSEDGRLFLVMELVEGKDLEALATTGVLPIDVLVYVAVEVLRALAYAHDLPVGSAIRGIIHRDVSPRNVLLSWEGGVKLSDFGIAKARTATEATASMFIKGKPAYMSPEQASGQALDGRSDLFAVGIMMWELLVGRRLFVGDDMKGTLYAVLFSKIQRPRSFRGDVPRDVERVVMKLLERDLSARYRTAEQAIKDLMLCADIKRGMETLSNVMTERFSPTPTAYSEDVMLAQAATVAASSWARRPQRKLRAALYVMFPLIAASVCTLWLLDRKTEVQLKAPAVTAEDRVMRPVDAATHENDATAEPAEPVDAHRLGWIDTSRWSEGAEDVGGGHFFVEKLLPSKCMPYVKELRKRMPQCEYRLDILKRELVDAEERDGPTSHFGALCEYNLTHMKKDNTACD